MHFSDFFNSATCPWWVNAITFIFSVLIIRGKWKRSPMTKDDAFVFGWMLIIAFVNFEKMLAKLAQVPA